MSYIGNQPTSVAFLTDQFSGTGSQTAFTLSASPANTASILVAVSGVLQDPTTYATSGLTLTFSAAPPSGTGNISVRYLGIPASNIATTAYRTQTEFTATAGQTTFSVPSYTVGFIDVYRNGALLGSADFTATNGTTVVLTNAASSGDLIETISFFVSSVLNAIPAVNNAVTTAYINDASVTQAKLATNTAGNGPAFSVYLAGTQTLPSTNTFTKILFDTKEYDTNTNFSLGTSRFTPTVAGYYLFTWNMEITASYGFTLGGVYKNGGVAKQGNWHNASSGASIGSAVVYANGSTDYFELYINFNGNGQNVGGGSAGYWFQGTMVRAA